MTDHASSLLMLQHGDSFFPSGSVAFSYGMESLCADAKIQTHPDVQRFVEQHLRYRWATLDRTLLRKAWCADGNLDIVQSADMVQQRMSIAHESRTGSWRAGRALLSVHKRLGTRCALEYSERIDRRSAQGHLCVVQGLVWWGVGLSVEQAETLSVHTMCVGMVSAAIRLGVIGHTGAQRLLTELRALAGDVLDIPCVDPEAVRTFTPAADIAMMRHEWQTARVFSN